MEVPAGDERTNVLLLKHYKAVGCYYCRERRGKPTDAHVHTNCPYRPCYLCKQEGHRATSCPYRTKPNAHESALRAILENREKRSRMFHFVREREVETCSESIHPSVLRLRSRQFDSKAAFIGRRVHQKRVTAVEWLPGDSHILSGDKAGMVRLWSLGNSMRHGWLDVDELPRRSAAVSYAHHCNVTQIALDPFDRELVYTAASDGFVCGLRLNLMRGDTNADKSECVADRQELLNLNPDGWQGNINKFIMMYGLTFHKERRCLYAGASDGTIRRFDPREQSKTPGLRAKFHKDKVTCIDVNPLKSDLIATASNDKRACLWDARKFIADHEIGSYTHGRVVSSAYFSPNTGSKLLTTSFDNKLQVWNDVHAFQGNVNEYPDAAPLEIIHSHNFHRHLNGFKAVWDPKDWRDDLFICGRFMGDAYYDNADDPDDATMLHPIDLFSAETGSVVHSLVDSSMPLICPTNKFSATSDVILTAASGDLVLWSPPPRAETPAKGAAGHRRGSAPKDKNADSSGDDEDAQPRKKQKLVPTPTVAKRRSGRRKAAS